MKAPKGYWNRRMKAMERRMREQPKFGLSPKFMAKCGARKRKKKK